MLADASAAVAEQCETTASMTDSSVSTASLSSLHELRRIDDDDDSSTESSSIESR